MNLKRLFFWKDEKKEGYIENTENILFMPNVNKEEVKKYLGENLIENRHNKFVTRFNGLLNEQELIDYFKKQYYIRGYYAGAQIGTADGLNDGVFEVISEFQYALNLVMERKKKTISEIDIKLIQIRGIEGSESEELVKKSERHQKDLDELERQISISINKSGWVFQSIKQYEIGFRQAIRETIEIDFLGRAAIQSSKNIEKQGE